MCYTIDEKSETKNVGLVEDKKNRDTSSSKFVPDCDAGQAKKVRNSASRAASSPARIVLNSSWTPLSMRNVQSLRTGLWRKKF